MCAPETAARQVGRIMEGIHSLSEMPMRYRLYDDEPWHSQGMRFFPVDNYLVFYLPEEMENTVYIVRIMYGGRDVRRQLKDTKMEY
ncbi:MAG: type II toxin-antitoxin system RelE/ParE family toxin [Bacteroidales bacterium]|nr:type II toxin-antitoxin system RelE/ParE family toxin [Bacteroidales bacterium]